MAHKCDRCKYKGEHQEMGFVPFGVCLKEPSLIKAERSYKADNCPFIVDVYANGTTEELQKTLEDLRGEIEVVDFQKTVETIRSLAQSLTETLKPIIDSTIETMKKYCDAIYCYPNKKVVHLALYHPKEKVRNKNMRRIMRWIERNGKKR